MRIGVDFRIVSRHKGGMAVYAKTLMDHLLQIDSDNEYVLLEDRTVNEWGGRHKLQWITGEFYWLQVKLIKFFKQEKFDVGFFPNPPVPFLLAAPIVLTIPDMAFVYDKGMPGWIKLYLYIMYFLSAHKAKSIITFSNSSKKDISKILKISPKKIQVTPLAAAEAIKPKSATMIAGDLKKYRISEPYILAVPGTFLPRKNMADLLQAFAEVLKTSKFPYQLVIVGITEGVNFLETARLSKELGIDKQVIFTGRLNDECLSSIYCGASLFVCTSLYEGFGLPILEAMKCGAPVISYANSSLPEVVGKAGILVNGQPELTEMMKNVLGDRVLQEDLRKKGLKQAALFSWNNTARKFSEAIKTVVSDKIS